MFSFWSLLGSGLIHIAPFFLASFVRFSSLAFFWSGSFLLTLSCLLVGLLFAVEAHHAKCEAAGVMAQRGGGPAALQWRLAEWTLWPACRRQCRLRRAKFPDKRR